MHAPEVRINYLKATEGPWARLTQFNVGRRRLVPSNENAHFCGFKGFTLFMVAIYLALLLFQNKVSALDCHFFFFYIYRHSGTVIFC